MVRSKKPKSSTVKIFRPQFQEVATIRAVHIHRTSTGRIGIRKPALTKVEPTPKVAAQPSHFDVEPPFTESPADVETYTDALNDSVDGDDSEISGDKEITVCTVLIHSTNGIDSRATPRPVSRNGSHIDKHTSMNYFAMMDTVGVVIPNALPVELKRLTCAGTVPTSLCTVALAWSQIIIVCRSIGYR
jgi:hypothetical protein